MIKQETQTRRLEIARYFPIQKGWEMVTLSPDDIDRRNTVPGAPIRCVDRRNGMTPAGYSPDTIPLGPAWLGALDGIAAFFRGSADTRMAMAVDLTEAVGFSKAVHGDYLLGDLGCAFRRAWFGKAFPGLEPLSEIEWRIIRKKLGIHRTDLHDAPEHADGFVLNDKPFTTVLSEGGKYYTFDLWFPKIVGIGSERFMPVVEKCGELILGTGPKKLFLINE